MIIRPLILRLGLSCILASAGVPALAQPAPGGPSAPAERIAPVFPRPNLGTAPPSLTALRRGAEITVSPSDIRRLYVLPDYSGPGLDTDPAVRGTSGFELDLVYNLKVFLLTNGALVPCGDRVVPIRDVSLSGFHLDEQRAGGVAFYTALTDDQACPMVHQELELLRLSPSGDWYAPAWDRRLVRRR